MLNQCKAIGCGVHVLDGMDFCSTCVEEDTVAEAIKPTEEISLAEKYPQYYKAIGDQTEIDVYAVHFMFDIKDSSGCIQHASKKLLLSGVRTGGKSVYKDIKEARDTLTRWLQLNEGNQ